MSNLYSFPGLSNHQIREVAVRAVVDPRSVVRYLKGDPQSQMMRTRVETALRASDLERFVRAAAPTTAG